MFYVPKNTQKTYDLRFNDFKGVDFTNSKLKTASNRATKMKNMIYDGKNHKRPPFIETLKLEGNINGCWSFTDNYQNKHTIVHCGNDLYKIIKDDDSDGFDINSIYTKAVKITPVGVTINDEKSNAIASDERLYMFVGTYLVYGTWNSGTSYEVREVANDEDTYIPITTTNISSEESLLNTRLSLEEVNMLSSKRKNKCIGMPLDEYIIHIGDILDNAIIQFFTDIDFSVLISDKTIFSCKETYADSNYSIYSIKYQHSPRTIYYEKADSNQGYISDNIWTATDGWLKNISELAFSGEVLINSPIANNYFCYINQPTTYTLDTKIDDETQVDIAIDCVTIQNIDDNDIFETHKVELRKVGAENNIYEIDSLVGHIVGEVDTTLDGYTQIKLYSNYAPITEGEPNITVTFTKANDNNLSTINKCKFCTLFSVEGGHYLFASGNPDKPNVDWHSEYRLGSTTATLSDFTYFPDRSYAVMGNAKDKIMGYSLVGDNTLAIHKEANGQRDTLYLRTATTSVATEIQGTKYYKVNFHLQQGASGEGVISSFCNDNLLNDNLFLSRNGVFGLSLTSNIKSNERYALERSALINGKLTKEPNLENACAIAFNGKYYLSVNENVYVADSRFKSYVSVDLPDTFSYEWWFWENINANILFQKDNELYFGTKEGQICRFDFNAKEYADLTFQKIDTITLGEEEESGKIKFSIDPDDVEFFENLTENDFIQVRGIETEGGKETDLYYKDSDNEIRQINYFCEIINYENQSFQLLQYKEKDVDGNTILHPLEILNNAEYDYASYTAYLVHREPIEAYYYTFITNCGVPLYTKRLTYLCATPEQIGNSEMTVGILTRNHKDKEVDVEGVNVFDFEDLDFTNFTFYTDDLATSFTKRLGINFNYIGFYFKSTNDRDFAMHDLTIYYQLTKLNKGVR